MTLTCLGTPTASFHCTLLCLEIYYFYPSMSLCLFEIFYHLYCILNLLVPTMHVHMIEIYKDILT